MYHGAFERNFANLKPGASTFEGSDGSSHQIPAWPAGADGVCIGYMEKTGKKFCAVRVVFKGTDIVLKDELVLDAATHMGHGKRFGAKPTLVDDDAIMVTLLEDIMKRNPTQGDALMPIRKMLKVPTKPKK
jgi:hypothetical protein